MLMRHPSVTRTAEAVAPETGTFTGNRGLET